MDDRPPLNLDAELQKLADYLEHWRLTSNRHLLCMRMWQRLGSPEALRYARDFWRDIEYEFGPLDPTGDDPMRNP